MTSAEPPTDPDESSSFSLGNDADVSPERRREGHGFDPDPERGFLG
jgi:hypothetical protein